MMNLNREPEKFQNMDDLLEWLAYERDMSEENTFLDLNEPEILDDVTFRRMYSNEFSYAVVIN